MWCNKLNSKEIEYKIRTEQQSSQHAALKGKVSKKEEVDYINKSIKYKAFCKYTNLYRERSFAYIITACKKKLFLLNKLSLYTFFCVPRIGI